MAVAISRSLAHIWHTLQDQLVNRVAETYTDLVGPLRQLSETACPASGGPPNEAAFNEQMKVFLVCFSFCSSEVVRFVQLFLIFLHCSNFPTHLDKFSFC
ncbi:unnamed protein product [Echinostoma caproni]|uniref:Uncharacterized protein n=1 Tax=Echinostoma caproni TaxID=27848 RepID=A0A3P8FTK7_9TREM|nr:unnamed protein product [Echinostoma caproni]